MMDDMNNQQIEALLAVRRFVERNTVSADNGYAAGVDAANRNVITHIDWLLEQVNAGHSIPLKVKINPEWPFDAQLVRTNPPPTHSKPPAPLGPPPLATAPQQPAPQPLTGWRSIRTAPRDGTHILAALPDRDTCYVICWADAERDIRRHLGSPHVGWHTAYDGDFLQPQDEPTHWMPLPDVPGIGEQP